jgi:hypothetical protein
MATALATRKQESFLLKLARERQGEGTPELRVQIMQDILTAGFPQQSASRLISKLLKRPMDTTSTLAVIPQQRSNVAQPKEVAAELTPGVYDVDGHVYVVKPNQAKTRLYAKRLVEIATDRLNAEGDMVQIEFVYEAGAIFNIKPSHKMSFDDAKMLTIRYGRCIVCNRRLKAGKSVEQGIGPVCRKSFA